VQRFGPKELQSMRRLRRAITAMFIAQSHATTEQQCSVALRSFACRFLLLLLDGPTNLTLPA
jgi:hypothetical protein